MISNTSKKNYKLGGSNQDVMLSTGCEFKKTLGCLCHPFSQCGYRKAIFKHFAAWPRNDLSKSMPMFLKNDTLGHKESYQTICLNCIDLTNTRLNQQQRLTGSFWQGSKEMLSTIKWHCLSHSPGRRPQRRASSDAKQEPGYSCVGANVPI